MKKYYHLNDIIIIGPPDHATTDCLWARSFLLQLGLLQLDQPTTILCDNEAAIKIAKHHMITPRSKHFDTKLHFTREQITNGNIDLKHTPGKDNAADIFTKPLSRIKFTKFRQALGLLDLSV